MRRQHLAYLGCSLAVGVFSGFNNFSLSLWLGDFVASLALISLLANTRGAIGSVVSPLAGAWSDRTWLGWLGRRRPFILFGGLTAALLMATTPLVARLALAGPGLPPWLGTTGSIIVLLLTITVAFNLMDDLHKALLADLTEEGPTRNRLASLGVVTDMGGQVTILVLGFLLSSLLGGRGVPDATFLAAAGLVIVGVLVTVLGVREPPPEAWRSERLAEAAVAEARPGVAALMRRYRGALLLGLVVFAYWFGVNAVLPLISLYTRNILGASDAEAQLLPALLLLSTTVMAVPAGLLGTRFGKRRIIAGGYMVMIFSALLGLVITTREQGAALFLLAGVGNAASMVLTIPLLADLVPRQHMGAAAGLIAAAGGLAAPLSSLVAGTLADQYGERAIFGVMAVMVLIALGLLALVRAPAPVAAASELAGEYT